MDGNQDELSRRLAAQSSLSLVRFLAQCWALAVEAVGRALDEPALDTETLVHRAVKIVANPTPEVLEMVRLAWSAKHPEYSDSEISQVWLFISVSRRNIGAAFMELARRRSTIPVAHKFTDLWTSGADPQAFFKALDVSLRRTVERKLDSTDSWTEPYWDPIQTAVVGAVARYQRGMKRLQEKIQELPIALPEVQVQGMAAQPDDGRDWTAIGTDVAHKFILGLAPIFGGFLEFALPDAAHEAQRKERDRDSAKMRGGTGGRHAKQAGTDEQEVGHVGWDDVTENKILDVDGAEPERKTSETLTAERERVSLIVEAAKTYPGLGPRGAQYIEASLRTNSKKAAQALKIPKSTASLYYRKLQALIAEKFSIDKRR
jgi:hypothetical protein